MAKIQVSCELNATPTVVWEDVRNIGTHVEWMHDAEAIDFTTATTEGVGTTFDCATKVGPLRLTDKMEITAWEPASVMGVRHVGLVTGEGQFTLAALGDDRTRFEWAEELRFPWWMGGPIGGVVGGRILQAIWRRNLRLLAARFG